MKARVEWWGLPVVVRIGVACSLLLAVAGCQENPAEPERYAPAEGLEGAWRWAYSVDVSTQQTHSPSADGFEAELTFIADSERAGSFLYQRTGAPEVTGEFSIGYEDAPGNDFLVLDHSIDFLESHAWLAAGPDSLWLGGVFEGGYNSMYARVSE